MTSHFYVFRPELCLVPQDGLHELKFTRAISIATGCGGRNKRTPDRLGTLAIGAGIVIIAVELKERK